MSMALRLLHTLLSGPFHFNSHHLSAFNSSSLATLGPLAPLSMNHKLLAFKVPAMGIMLRSMCLEEFQENVISSVNIC